ncbi:MAG: hypothetical protein AB7I41_14835 [Candidatus Sericytochromatia bacterium]
MKQAFIYLLCFGFWGLSMMISGQKILDYFTFDILFCTALVCIGYSVLAKKTELQLFAQLLLKKPLENEALQRGLNSLKNGWYFVLQLMSTFVLLQSINALVHAGDKQSMQYLGSWLATVLLTGLYLLLLRWGVFLPLENSLKRRQIVETEF